MQCKYPHLYLKIYGDTAIHHFKIAAKQCAFGNDTVVIHIFVKCLGDAPTIASKMYKKDPQILAYIIRLAEELSAAHQLTATLTPSKVSMMSCNDKCLSVDEQVILATTAPMPSVIAVMNLVTLPRTAPTIILHQEHHTTMADFIQGFNAPTTRGTNYCPIMVQDIGEITEDDSPTPIYTVTEAAALEGTPCPFLPATAAAYATLQLMDAPITHCALIPTDIVTPHPTLTTSPEAPLHRPEPALLKQLSQCHTRISAQ